jgi:hypothetical protein
VKQEEHREGRKAVTWLCQKWMSQLHCVFASPDVIIFQRQRASRVAYPELVEWSVTFWGPKSLIVGRCDPKSDSEDCQGKKNAQKMKVLGI